MFLKWGLQTVSETKGSALGQRLLVASASVEMFKFEGTIGSFYLD